MFVYFVTKKHFKRSPIKIGKAIDIKKRLSGLQTSSPDELECLGYIEGDLEATLHMRFATHRVRGEWFARHPDILDYIEDHCTKMAPDNNTPTRGRAWRQDRYYQRRIAGAQNKRVAIAAEILEKLNDHLKYRVRDQAVGIIKCAQQVTEMMGRGVVTERDLKGLRTNLRRALNEIVVGTWQDAEGVISCGHWPAAQQRQYLHNIAKDWVPNSGPLMSYLTSELVFGDQSDE